MVKNKLIEIIGDVKTKLGICSHKKCFHRACAEIVFSAINVKRCLCSKHLLEFEKLELKGYIQERIMRNNEENESI